jgi:(E)-4-hydroxy-3-methylbut-2-enyl-diphosphate synthase
MQRKKTRKIKVGNTFIGGDSPITVQSMCNTKTKDINATINQIHELEEAGCEIIRVAVPDKESVKTLKEIKENITIPLVADIHFNHMLVIESAKYVDKIRINPGNIGNKKKIKSIINTIKDYALPIRIGINAGSLEKTLIEKYGVTSKAMVESALNNIRVLENLNFYNTIISLKASDIQRTIESYQLISQKTDYPLHLGITEAGTNYSGSIKSAIAFGILLNQGIGDTIRVSLTADPIKEVKAGFEILNSLGIRRTKIEIISCPTCGRCHGDLIKIANKIEKLTGKIKKPIKIAIMGCEVNGPGEAKEADIGVALGDKKALIFKKSEIIKTIEHSKIINELSYEINHL